MLLVPYMWASMTFLPYMWASMTFWPKMYTVDCETAEEYFYDSEQSLASEASEDSFHSANE